MPAQSLRSLIHCACTVIGVSTTYLYYTAKGEKKSGNLPIPFWFAEFGIILRHINGMLILVRAGFGRGLFYQLWMLWSCLTTARFFWLCVQAMLRLARLQSSTQNGDRESSLSSHVSLNIRKDSVAETLPSSCGKLKQAARIAWSTSKILTAGSRIEEFRNAILRYVTS